MILSENSRSPATSFIFVASVFDLPILRRAFMTIALPNELLVLILSDAIGTYVHSFILLPSDYHCWPGHYVLRSVSKHFKALIDDIWSSAIGGEKG
jgi:hypothetical protein